MSGKHSLMGIVNITPDSFSDGGSYNSICKIKEKFKELKNYSADIIDIGAESTAPFNDKIDKDVEIKRLEELFFPLLKEKIFDELTIFSIDTYKVETFKKVHSEIRKLYKKNLIIWNDISGVIDDELLETLREYPDIKYVFCHTNTLLRDRSQNHMSEPFFFVEQKSLDEIERYFNDGLKIFVANGFSGRVIFDPGFGFSKSSSHNLFLIKNIDLLLKRFSDKQEWLIGISRKSFLKSLVKIKSIDSSIMMQTEYLQLLIIDHFKKVLKDFNIIYRLHDPAVYNSITSYKSNFLRDK